MDSDDLWLPQRLERQLRALDQFEDHCGACISDAWFMNNPHMKMTLFQLAGKQHSQTIGMITEPLTYMLEKNSVVGVHPVWLQNLVTRTDLARRVGGLIQRSVLVMTTTSSSGWDARQSFVLSICRWS